MTTPEHNERSGEWHRWIQATDFVFAEPLETQQHGPVSVLHRKLIHDPYGVALGEWLLHAEAMRFNQTMPVDVLVPVLGYPDVSDAVEWLTAAFGFRLRWQISGHRAQLAVGPTAGLAIVQSNSSPTGADEVMVRVDDVDAHAAVSRAHGAEITQDPETHVYGERQYVARDYTGRSWCFSESVEDRAPRTWGAVEGPGLRAEP